MAWGLWSCRPHASTHALRMFVVTEAEAAAIRTAFEQGGELAAALELRRLFPGVTDMAEARECGRIIAGWKPIRLPPRGQPALDRRPSPTQSGQRGSSVSGGAAKK